MHFRYSFSVVRVSFSAFLFRGCNYLLLAAVTMNFVFNNTGFATRSSLALHQLLFRNAPLYLAFFGTPTVRVFLRARKLSSSGPLGRVYFISIFAYGQFWGATAVSVALLWTEVRWC
jgi:hypothetical protein